MYYLYTISLLWRRVDSNRRTQRERFYRPPRLATSLLLQMMARDGIEPPTQGASILCSTTELPSHLTVHMGFEPMISSVTGRRDKPLLQWTKLRELDLNQRPSGYEPDELPDCSIPRYSIKEDVGFEPTRGRTA